MTIGEIKNIYKKITKEDELSDFIKRYEADERAGVQALVSQSRKKIDEQNRERERSYNMLAFERKYTDMGYNYICGIDEVGRGPLAGPVVACGVILPKDEIILYLNDSKQVSRNKREELYDIILDKCIACGIGIVSEKRIDEINILQATYEAMRIAIENLRVKPDILLNDAVKIPLVDTPQVPIIKGDTLSASIAAASIVAKVTRDKIMEEYDSVYPGYDFSNNMGYGSQKHIEGLKKYGCCEIHRQSFIKNII